MARSNLKAENVSDAGGVVKVAVHEIIKNTQKEVSPRSVAVQPTHHATLPVTGEMQG